MTIEKTLEERGNRYGSFLHHARVAQRLQDAMRSETGWEALAADQKQALTVIADKIARMLAGDPSYRDNWHDIVGYAKLVDDRMAKDEEAPSAAVFDPHGALAEAVNADEALRDALVDVAVVAEEAWTDWKGGERPVGMSVKVEVVYRAGGTDSGKAGSFRWWHAGAHSAFSQKYDVIAYRVVRTDG